MNRFVLFVQQPGTHRTPAMGPLLTCLLAFFGMAMPVGCTGVPELRFRLDENVRIPERRVVLFVVDGMDADRTTRLIDEGRLPNIRHRFVDRGVQFSRAFGVFPSVTYSNCTSIMTGRFPGGHGIVGNCWYDPETATFRDYRVISNYLRVNDDLQTPTLFQLLPDVTTLNLRYIMSQGADMNYKLSKRAKILWWFGQGEASDRQIIHEMRKALRRIRKRGVWPGLTVAYLPAVDEIGHHHGPDSPEYARALENVDRIIGRVVDACVESGLDESTYYLLLSDHAMVATPDDRRFDLVRWFREKAGQRVWTGDMLPCEEAKRRAILTQYDMILNVDAGRVARIYLPTGKLDSEIEQGKHRQEWLRKPQIQRFMTNEPAIDLCMTPYESNGVTLRSRHGQALVVCESFRPETFRFEQYEGDPLGYRKHEELKPYLAGEAIPGDLSLPLTADTDYPDLVRQVVNLFQSNRAGDLILTAADDWTFHPTWKGGHGSPLRQDMRIPLYLAGPGISSAKVEASVSSVDIVPTILEWLDAEPSGQEVIALDGNSLLPRLESVQ